MSAIAKPEPIIAPKRPFGTRLRLWFSVWAFKAMVVVGISLARRLKSRGFGLYTPTHVKKYGVAGNLPSEVWLPENYKPGTQLPLFIDCHGGGFAIGDPGMDAEFCHYLANKHNFCVVSINYRKSPRFAFPHPVKDVADMVLKVLSDPDLPVDKTKVVLSGFSAGANLALTSAATPELQGKLKGLILWYPVADFSGKYKGEFQTASDGTPDVLVKTADLFEYAYVPAGTDRTDPRLSPVYESRSNLPSKLLFIGAEHDVLCNEAEVTARRYAEQDGNDMTKTDGRNDWTMGGITWKKVLDAQHGFNFVRKKLPESEEKRVKITAEVYQFAAEWVQREIYS